MSILYIAVFVFITITTFSLSQVYGEPIIYDDDYVIEKFVTGLEWPTTMTFVGDDILVLEKNTGKVFRVQANGVISNEPVLDVPVASKGEAGLLGITFASNHVYLYFTESLSGVDQFGYTNARNAVYQYDWNGDRLINPILIKDLKQVNVDYDGHHGGVMTTGLNNEVYFVVGDQDLSTTTQNISVEALIQFTQPNVIPVTSSIFKIDTENNNVELFAMGIRNSFGLGVDPVTGYLWDTENGPDNWDEINLVKPGFNSGWRYIMGPAELCLW